MTEFCSIERYRVPLDRRYHREDGTWVLVSDGRVRIGMDDLSQETAGDLAQLYLLPVGASVAAGDELGSIEAQKYVGALRSPVSGTVVEINEAVLANPRLVNEDPFGAGWLVVLDPGARLVEEIEDLVGGDDVETWFAQRLDTYRRQGAIAE